MKSKRGIAVILLACLMLSVTACGGGQAEDTIAKADAEKIREEAEAEMKERHQERTQNSQKAADSEDSGGNNEARGDDEEIESTEEGSREQEKSDSEEAADDGYVRGKMTDTTYESEWIGLRYELPAGFSMSSEDEMDAILQAGGSMLYEDKVDDIVDYAKLVMVYEMMAKDKYGNVLTLFVEKTAFDIDTYVAAIKMQMENVDVIDITIDDGETAQVGGVEFEKYTLTLDYGGVIVKENYYLKKKGDRMICLLMGYSEDEAAETMMSGFLPY